jgi:hypothetical protein
MSFDIIQYSGEGNDNEHPNNEWVQFENGGDAAVSLDGWMLTDGYYEYEFSGVTVEPGDTIRVYTGKGEDTGSEVYWGYESAVWNDDGDTVYLYDDNGNQVVYEEYDGSCASDRHPC